MGSTPYPGTIQDLTLNLFNILADNRLLANALFWLTVWLTAEFQGRSFQRRGYWSHLSLRFGCLLGVGVDKRGRLLRLRPWVLVLGLAVMDRWSQCWIVLLEAY